MGVGFARAGRPLRGDTSTSRRHPSRSARESFKSGRSYPSAARAMTIGRDTRTETSATADAGERASLHALIHTTPHAVLLVDAEGIVLDANDRVAALLNRGENHLPGRGLAGFVKESDRPALARRIHLTLQGEEAGDLDVRPVRPRGNEDLISLTFLLAPTEVGRRVLVLVRDLTREQEARDRATRDEVAAYRAATVETRKLADLGKLVSGVTHELRTPLTFVTNTISLQQQRIEDLARRHPALGDDLGPLAEQNRQMVDGIQRVNRLIRELRPLAKNRPHRTARMDLAELVIDAVKVFRGSTEGNARVVLDLEATHEIPIDKEDMVNVLLNLLNNASQAMGGRGTIRISTRNQDQPPEIRVIDDGPGVPPEDRERIFDPFYTTKPDGTGLGLFISRRTVEDHGGTLTCETAPGGKGAAFVVKLPLPEA